MQESCTFSFEHLVMISQILGIKYLHALFLLEEVWCLNENWVVCSLNPGGGGI